MGATAGAVSSENDASRVAALTAAQLAQTYGKGHQLLMDMGYTASNGLRPGSARAPLRIREPRTSRPGVRAPDDNGDSVVRGGNRVPESASNARRDQGEGERARPGPLDSPGLRQFLIEEQLQYYCYVNHIAINYRGDDRPRQGFESWLEQLSFLEKFTDDHGEACVIMREPTLSGDAPRGQVKTTEAPREDLRGEPRSPRGGRGREEFAAHVATQRAEESREDNPWEGAGVEELTEQEKSPATSSPTTKSAGAARGRPGSAEWAPPPSLNRASGRRAGVCFAFRDKGACQRGTGACISTRAFAARLRDLARRSQRQGPSRPLRQCLGS